MINNIAQQRHLTLYRMGLVLIFMHLWLSAQTSIAQIYLPFKNVMLVLIIIVFAIQTQYMKLSVKSILIISVGTIVALYNYTLVNDAWILYSFLLVVYSKNLNLVDVIGSFSKYLIIIFVINMMIFIPQYLFGSASYIDTTEEKRYLMNFQSPNEATMTWVSIVFAYYYTHSFNTIKGILVIIVSLIMYHLTSSDAIWFIAIIPIVFLCRKNRKILRFLNSSAQFAFTFFCLGTFFLIYQKPLWVDYLDTLLFTGRLNLSKLAIEQFGYTWFGQQVELFTGIGNGINYHFLVVDNAYAYIAIRTGLVFLIAICVLFAFSPVKNNYKAALCYILYALLALAENNILNPLFIFPLIIAFNIRRNNEHSILHSRYN